MTEGSMILALSDEVQLAIVGAFVAICTTLGTVLTAWLNSRSMARANAPVRAALAEQNVTTQQNKEDTDKRLDTIKDEMVTTATELVRTEGLAKAQEVVASDKLAEKVAEKVVRKIETNVPAAPSVGGRR